MIGIVFTPLIARTVRAAVLLERELDYVAAARLRGERAALHHVRRDPPERDRRRSWSSSRSGSATPCSRSSRCRSSASASRRRRRTGGSTSPANYGQVVAPGTGGRCCSTRSRSPRWWSAVNLIADAIRAACSSMSTVPTTQRRRRRRPASRRARRRRRRHRLPRPRRDQRVVRDVSSTSPAASPTAWSASRAAASRRSRSRSSATWPATAGSARARSRSTAATCSRSTRAELRELRAKHRVDGLPGAGPGAEPVDQRRAPGRRGVRDRRRRPQARRWNAEEMLEKVRISDPDRGHAPLSAPALGRHAAARGDRDGAGRRAVAADPRRADDRARRHRRGRGARPDPGLRSEFDTSLLFISHNLGGDREDVRPGRRAVRRRAGRGGPGPRGVRRPPPPLHGRAAALHSPPRRRCKGREHARHDPRLPAGSGTRSRRAASSPTAAAWCEDRCRSEIAAACTSSAAGAALALSLPRARPERCRGRRDGRRQQPLPDATRGRAPDR